MSAFVKSSRVLLKNPRCLSASSRRFASASLVGPTPAAASVSFGYRDALGNVPETKVTRLPNGVTVATETNSNFKTATVGLWIRAGSRNEAANVSGVAHLLEHMIFKGSAKRSGKDIASVVDSFGGSFNAYTGREHTAFYVKSLGSDVSSSVEILADSVLNPAIAEDAVAAEKKKVLAEIDAAEKDKEGLVYDHLHGIAFQGSSLAKTILGSAKGLNSVSAADLANFAKTYYTADRLVLVGAGDVSHEALVKLAETHFGSAKASEGAAKLVKPTFVGSDVRARYDDYPVAHIAFAVEGASWTSPDFWPLAVANTIVGKFSTGVNASKHTSSKLAQKINQYHLAEYLKTFYFPYSDTGIFGIYTETQDRMHLDDLTHYIQQEWHRLAMTITDAEVFQAKNILKTGLLSALENTDAIADDIGKQVLNYGKRLTPWELDGLIESVTAGDITKAAGNYIYDKEVAVVGYGPVDSLSDYTRIRSAMSPIYCAGTLSAEIVEQSTLASFIISIRSLEGNGVRVKVDEKNATRKRFELEGDLALVPLPYTGFSDHSVTSDSVKLSNGDIEVKMKLAPFQFDVLHKNKIVFTFNERHYLNYEHHRAKPGPDEPAEPVPDTSQLSESEKEIANLKQDVKKDSWEESFGGRQDSKPYGPMSIGFDLTFHGSKHLYGLPEHASSLALKSTRGPNALYTDPFRLYNFDVFEYELNNPMALYGSIPYILGHSEGRSVGALWVNAAEMWVDVEINEEKGHSSTHWMAESGLIDLILYASDSPKTAVSTLSRYTGQPLLPQLFAIAYHQCRWNYLDENDVFEVDSNFDKYDIPYDVLWLDIEHTDGKKYFTWDKVKFPNPKDMQKRLSSRGRKMVTIIDPHIKREDSYVVSKNAKDKDLFVKSSSSNWLDYLNEAARSYWANLFKYENYEGSTDTLYTWNDMNEPSVFNGPEITMPKDNLHHGGLPFVGADIGGFFGNPEPDLLVRWYQAAAFQPFVRAHAHIDTKRREPWIFGEPYVSRVRSAIRDRYRLLPYVYTLFFEAHEKGIPVMRPLLFEFPNDPRTFALDDAFMLGNAILVHPVAEKDLSSVETYLPPSSVWYDYYSFKLVASGDLKVELTADSIPVFLRGGSIVARRDRVRRAASLSLRDPLTLIVALDAKGKASGSVYIDDGKSYQHETGKYIYAEFEFKDGRLTSKSIRRPSLAGGKAVSDLKALDVFVERVIVVGLPKKPAKINRTTPSSAEVAIDSIVESDGKYVVVAKKPQIVLSDLYDPAGIERKKRVSTEIWMHVLATACFFEMEDLAAACSNFVITNLSEAKILDYARGFEILRPSGSIIRLTSYGPDHMYSNLLKKYTSELYSAILSYLCQTVNSSLSRSSDDERINIFNKMPIWWLRRVIECDVLAVESEFERYTLLKSIVFARREWQRCPEYRRELEDESSKFPRLFNVELGSMLSSLAGMKRKKLSNAASKTQGPTASVSKTPSDLEHRASVGGLVGFYPSAAEASNQGSSAHDKRARTASFPGLLNIYGALGGAQTEEEIEDDKLIMSMFESSIRYSYMTFLDLEKVKQDKIVPTAAVHESLWAQQEITEIASSSSKPSSDTTSYQEMTGKAEVGRAFRFAYRFRNVKYQFDNIDVEIDARTGQASSVGEKCLFSNYVKFANDCYRICLSSVLEADRNGAESTAGRRVLKAHLQRNARVNPDCPAPSPCLSYHMFVFDVARFRKNHEQWKSFSKPLTARDFEGSGEIKPFEYPSNVDDVELRGAEGDGDVWVIVNIQYRPQ
ncbi:hypothetical protein HDU96_009155 [Phlyctochytrium bullatum]|nr:hypothetical protein HDU96_009155 [Phlyctochytrium bullatum]